MSTSYKETIDFLYSQLPTFHREGPGAYKPGLDTARALDSLFGNPSRKFASIHIAGTNGKGSTAHSLAAILCKAGYRTGLYTSPHIVDFRERIRIDGAMIPEAEVVDFVNRYMSLDTGLHPSFFELTTIMAFDYFARSGVDVAVIETGLGGRLDTTNIITPLLSIITNISPDHTSLLGDTPAAIAAEKAGIIKPGIPVVIGRADDESVRKVFTDTAARQNAPIRFAPAIEATPMTDGIEYHDTPYGSFKGELAGVYQIENTSTILTAVSELDKRLDIPAEAVRSGLADVSGLTGLRGRWTHLSDSPLTIYDTGHNPGGWQRITEQLASLAPHHIHLVVGFVADKDVTTILHMIAALGRAGGITLSLYLTAPSTPRRLEAAELMKLAEAEGLTATAYADVKSARDAAARTASADDMIFIGGSNFLIADLLANIN